MIHLRKNNKTLNPSCGVGFCKFKPVTATGLPLGAFCGYGRMA